jgi:DNA-binding transcriptional ArsR family regulator
MPSLRGRDRLTRVDRLTLFKVLADSSRYAIYQEVAGAEEPLSTFEIAERLDLHPNTVRLHPEKMRDAGLLEVFSDRHGAVGRPQHRWSVVPHAPSLGVEPSGFRVLAHLLAEVAAEPAGESERAAAVGRRRGLERTKVGPGSVREPNAGAVERGVGRACIRAIVDELADLGFDPVVDAPVLDVGATAGGPQISVGLSFTKCPFRELAVLYPDLVCELHRGLTQGILAGIAAGEPGVEACVEAFSSLVDADPCRADLSISGRSG